MPYWSLCYICKFNAVCFLYYLLHENNIRLTSYRQNVNIEKIYLCERAWKIFAFICPKIPISFRIGTCEFCLHNITCFRLFVGYFVTSVHAMQFPFYILLMTWHYIRSHKLPANTYSEIIYVVCERGKFSHFYIPNLLFLSFFWLVLKRVSWYNMTFNLEILGGGDYNTGHPPPQIWGGGGGGYTPPPRDRHPWPQTKASRWLHNPPLKLSEECSEYRRPFVEVLSASSFCDFWKVTISDFSACFSCFWLKQTSVVQMA